MYSTEINIPYTLQVMARCDVLNASICLYLEKQLHVFCFFVYKKMILKNLKKMLRKSPASNPELQFLKTLIFSWSSLKVTELSKFIFSSFS